MSTLLEDLKALCDDLDKMPPPKHEFALNVVDLHEKFKHLLTPEADAALAPELKCTINPVYGGESTMSLYLSARCYTERGVEKAVKGLYAVVNDLAKRGVLRGHLAKLSMLKIPGVKLHGGCKPATPDTLVVFVFPHVPVDWKVDPTIPYVTEEGGCGGFVERLCVQEDPCFEDDCPKCKGGPPSAG